MSADHALRGFWLWLEPTEPAASDAQRLIQTLAQRQTSSPIFSPHVTLIGPIPLETGVDQIKTRLTAAIAAAQQGDVARPLSLDVGHPQAGNHFYQCVLAPITGDRGYLNAIRAACEEAFDLNSLAAYFPHLSLLYGDMDGRTREEIAIGVVKDCESLPGVLSVHAVSIMNLTGEVKDWKLVGKVPLYT